MRTVSIFLSICFALAVSAPSAPAQTTPLKKLMYKGSVPIGNNPSVFLTNDSYETVSKFYKARFVKAIFPVMTRSTFETMKGEMGQESCRYGYMYLVEGGEVRGAGSAEISRFNRADYDAYVATLNEPSRTVLDPHMTPPFFYLRNEVQAKRHTQADLDKLVAKYEHILYTYYRIVVNPEGKEVPERDAIVRRHYERVYGSQSMAPGEKNNPDEAKIKQTRAKIKELKKQGKTAEMMELAMQMQKEMESTSTGKRIKTAQESQIKAMSTDNWAEWVQCIEELDKAGFVTKIHIVGVEDERN
jgi:hypothetical protein